MGFQTPVVLGYEIGRFARVLAARNAKHSASIASPRQLYLSAVSTLILARDEISFIIVGFFRPPPETINCVGRIGRRSRPFPTDAPTHAVRVAAPSSSDMPSAIL